MSSTTEVEHHEASQPDQTDPDLDVVVVGAGMAGLYLLYRLRALGLSATALEAADDVEFCRGGLAERPLRSPRSVPARRWPGPAMRYAFAVWH